MNKINVSSRMIKVKFSKGLMWSNHKKNKNQKEKKKASEFQPNQVMKKENIKSI